MNLIARESFDMVCDRNGWQMAMYLQKKVIHLWLKNTTRFQYPIEFNVTEIFLLDPQKNIHFSCVISWNETKKIQFKSPLFFLWTPRVPPVIHGNSLCNAIMLKMWENGEENEAETHLSTVNAVIVRTVALADVSAANPWRMHIVSVNG